MQMFVGAGFNKDKLRRLNRVCVHQQVLFLSCVLGASGKSLDKKYMIMRKTGDRWSKLKFPKEKPTKMNFNLWKVALRQIVPPIGIPDWLGRLSSDGYKIWNWRWDPTNRQLLHFKGDLMGIYGPSDLPRMNNVTNRWTMIRSDQEPEQCGQVCTICKVQLAAVAVASTAAPPREAAMPTKIKEVLKKWGCMWMWKSLRIVGNEEYIKDAIDGGTLVAVTDGLYIKEMYPNLCSAAFILECSKGSGQLFGFFPKCSQGANAYRGELMGLMAIHLILLALNKVWPELRGRTVIYSDCLGALSRVANLPPHRIPTKG